MLANRILVFFVRSLWLRLNAVMRRNVYVMNGTMRILVLFVHTRIERMCGCDGGGGGAVLIYE